MEFFQNIGNWWQETKPFQTFAGNMRDNNALMQQQNTGGEQGNMQGPKHPGLMGLSQELQQMGDKQWAEGSEGQEFDIFQDSPGVDFQQFGFRPGSYGAGAYSGGPSFTDMMYGNM